MLTSRELLEIFKCHTKKFKYDESYLPGKKNCNLDLKGQIALLHACNCFLWCREEDTRKSESISLEQIGRIKQKIDLANYNRNSIIGNIDALFYEYLPSYGDIGEFILNNTYQINSESLGQMIDRLSILYLKLFYTKSFVNKSIDSECMNINLSRIEKLEEQIKYISLCFDRYLTLLSDKKAYIPFCRQEKLYDDSHYYK